MCAAGVISLSSGTASARKDWAGRYSRCSEKNSDTTRPRICKSDEREGLEGDTHKDKKRYKNDVSEEVSWLAEAWRVELKAGRIRPRCGNNVSQIADEDLDCDDLLKYRSKTKEKPPPVSKNGVMNLQTSGNGSLKIHGR